MEIIFLSIGLITGLALGYFISQLKNKKAAQNSYEDFQQKYSELKIENTLLGSRLSSSENTVNKIELDICQERKKILELSNQLSASETNFKNSREKLQEQKQEMEKSHQLLLEQFENISSKVLRNNSSSFNEQSSEKLQLILDPLKEKIEKFERKVEDTYEKSLKDSSALKEQIKTLGDLNKQISEDAVNLTHALKGEKKTQGNWGEMLLESLLEKSGLEKGLQYITQPSFENSEGGKSRPDVVIHLPDNKHLVIDSKVSLVDYSNYCDCGDEGVRNIKLKDYLNCIRTHCNQLGSKRYDTLYGINSPDYVLMFVPIEPAFTLAMQNDGNLFLAALDKNIVLVTSSTLLATLRTVASIWKQENQKKNVLEIAEESGKLYDKFAGFIEDFKTIESHIQKSQAAYSGAMNKLTEGTGNIINRFEKLKKLGAKTNKSIDSKFLNSKIEE